jgi:hypothetical protein
MNLERQITEKGCIQYCDPDMRTMPVPVAIPVGFVMYRICGNGGCLNPQHMYFVDGEQAHQIEIDLRAVTLTYLRTYFKVDPETLQQIESGSDGQKPRIWLPKGR